MVVCLQECTIYTKLCTPEQHFDQGFDYSRDAGPIVHQGPMLKEDERIAYQAAFNTFDWFVQNY